MAASRNDKSLMRNLGEFVGHIVKGVKTKPEPRKQGKEGQTQEVRREVQEEDQGDVILRRTTIDEIEFKSDKDNPRKADHDEPKTGT